MSARTVFGRLRFWANAVDYKIEMRIDAIYIRQRHSRKEWRVPFEYLLRFCHQQLELFNEGMDKGNSGQPVPGVQEGQLVPDRDKANHVHEGVEQQPQDAQERGDGLAAQSGCDHKFIGSNICLKCGWEAPPVGELPKADVGVVPGNDTEDVSGPVGQLGSPPLDTV